MPEQNRYAEGQDPKNQVDSRRRYICMHLCLMLNLVEKPQQVTERKDRYK